MSAHMKTQTRSKHILFVDDEALVRKTMKMLLDSEGYAVETVDSGPGALDRLAGGGVDLVITDNFMPGMSGIDLAAAIHERWPALPVVMFSGNPPRKPPPGVVLVLHKPADVARLLDAAKEMLSR
jgi:CheY-like chemotaxis protein